MAKKKPPAQLDREIAESLARAAEAKLAAIARTRRPTPEESAAANAAYAAAAKATGARKTPAKPKSKPPLRIAYRLQLTPSELKAVEFARGRYTWPDMLAAHASESGEIAFTEPEMWQWCDDVDSDTEGNHSPFTLASPAFAEKLQSFYDERI